MKNNEIEFLGSMQRLEAKPGDRFVLQLDGNPSAEMAEKLQEHWRKWSNGELGDLLILGKGLSLGLIGKDTEDNGESGH